MNGGSITRKAQAFSRFTAINSRHSHKWLVNSFYTQSCFALGICNHSTWARINEDDARWDKLFKEGGAK